MKKSTKSILAVSLALAAHGWQPASACIFWEDPTLFNHFHCAPTLSSIEERNVAESAEFWAEYAGLECDERLISDVRYLSLWMLDDEDTSNTLIQALRASGKSDALDYLRLNEDLNQLVNSRNGWEYRVATRQDYEALMSRIDRLHAPGKLSRRKTFLKMRCMYAMKDYDSCIRLWDTFAARWEESCALRNRMEGYIAGIYYQREQYDKAIPMFFELGDDGSIQLCINRMLSSTSIEQEYQKDPNSQILPYILEDYANYYFHANHNENWMRGTDNPIWTAVTDNAQSSIALADRVAAEGKANDLQMWKAFAGFLQLCDGNYDQAYHSFEQAQSLNGNGVVSPCIRHYKFAAALQMEHKIRNWDKYLLNEMRYWTDNEIQVSPVEASTMSTMRDHLVMPHVLEYIKGKYSSTAYFVAQTALSMGYEWNLDRAVSLDEALAIRKYMTNSRNRGMDPLEVLLKDCASRYLPAERLNEFIGTKLMREGRYEEAAAELSNIGTELLNTLGITPYLMTRGLSKTPFTREDYSDPSWDSHDTPARNVKLEFCQRVIDLQHKIADSRGEQKAAYALELAKWLFHASAGGDLWAMSEYQQSVYSPTRNELSQQALGYLQMAIANSHDYNTLVEAHFGLAAIDVTNGSAYNDGNIVATGTQYQGYNWLKEQNNRSHEIFSTCDWLGLYLTSDNS